MRQLLLVLCVIIMPLTHAQGLLDREVTVKFQNENIEKCLTQIEKASGISFSYNSRQIHSYNKKITASFEKESVQNVLDNVLAGTKLQYKEIGQQITVYELATTAEEVIISGYIRDKKSGEELIGARIYFPQFGIGCISNTYGYYALEVPKGKTDFRVSSLGMLTLTDEVNIEQEMVMNFELELDTLVLNTIEVVSDSATRKENEIADLPQLDKTIITPTAISRIPAASGERDLMRHIQQLPGVQPSNDGGSNFRVRGSGTGGNLILIDEIPIYHPTHLLGIYSIINTDALKSATLYKDYIPLKFGTRSASVLQIHTNEGDLNRHHISGGISGFMARLNLEGPIVKKRASFYLSGRASTFPGQLLSILNNRNLGNPTFYDFNGKVNVKLNSNNRIYFTGYFGRDQLSDSTRNYVWGNVAGSFRWNHIVNTKTFSNLSLTHSEFAYGFAGFSYEDVSFGQKVITDKIAYDFTHFYNSTVKINYGFSAAFLRTNKGNFGEKDANLFLKRQSLENGVYASIEKKFSRKFNLKAGIRIPFSFHIGTGDTTAYLNSDLTQTQIIYQKNKFYDPVFFVDPRIVGTYRLTENDEFQFAAMVTSQNTHIISYINYFLPIEIWTPSTGYLRPERNFQASIGYTRKWKNFIGSAIVYHKFVTNVLDYASPVFTTSTEIESNLLAGTLRVSGLELMMNYRFTTWYSTSMSYAFTKTRQLVPGINNDLPYVAPSDRPHYFSFSQYFNLSKKWQITTNFIRHSGTAITLPNGQFVVDGTAFPLYSSNRNTERLPVFSPCGPII